jgi:hypothetical protein
VEYALLLLLTPMLGAANLNIDHVTVAGKDLSKMQASLASVGLHAEYGGPHSNHATEMAITSFPDGSYLELIAIQPQADPAAVAAHYWSPWLRSDAGPCAWAVRSEDVSTEIKRLQSAGVPMSGIQRSGRDRPDGTRLEWEAAPVGPEPNGTFFPFLIRDITPRDKRALPSGKPTTTDFSGVAKVIVAVHDLKAAVERYRKAYGLAAPQEMTDAKFGAKLAIFKGTPVVLAEPLNAQSWIAERLKQTGESPCAFVLGGHKSGSYPAASITRWSGVEISWFDAAKLGWHLGYEK